MMRDSRKISNLRIQQNRLSSKRKVRKSIIMLREDLLVRASSSSSQNKRSLRLKKALKRTSS